MFRSLFHGLHSTPEMQTFLQQVTILGCRLVDALASGKTKQLIHNGKNTIWQGMELAVDPSTTMALAEVTAHLCHALEELDDSFHPTPRAVRNTQNDTTYLRPLQMTGHQSDCIENVILSSLGFRHTESRDLFDDDDDMLANDGSSVNSVPSNVVFPRDTAASLLGETHPREPNVKDDHSMLGPCKGKVDVQLLRERILNQERPPARIPLVAMDDKDEESFPTFRLSSCGTAPVANNKDILADLFENVNNNSVKTHCDMEESAPTDVDSNTGKYHADSHWNLDKPYDTLEKRKNNGRETLAIKFYQTVDDLLQRQRAEKLAKLAKISSKASGIPVERVFQRRAKVRKFRGGGTTETKTRSKDIQKRYFHLRRMGKYPPFMLYFAAVVLGFVLLLWGAFGIYGFYTYFRVLDSQRSTPTNVVPLAQPMGPNGPTSPSEDLRTLTVNPRPNEIVLKIVREVIHVSNDGSDTHLHLKSDMNSKEESEFSEKEMKDILQCLSS